MGFFDAFKRGWKNSPQLTQQERAKHQDPVNQALRSRPFRLKK